MVRAARNRAVTWMRRDAGGRAASALVPRLSVRGTGAPDRITTAREPRAAGGPPGARGAGAAGATTGRAALPGQRHDGGEAGRAAERQSQRPAAVSGRVEWVPTHDGPAGA